MKNCLDSLNCSKDRLPNSFRQNISDVNRFFYILTKYKLITRLRLISSLGHLHGLMPKLLARVRFNH